MYVQVYCLTPNTYIGDIKSREFDRVLYDLNFTHTKVDI